MPYSPTSDCEATSTPSYSSTNTTISLKSTDYWGAWFFSVPIPAGATINSAVVTYMLANTNGGTTIVAPRIDKQSGGSTGTLPTSYADISGRTYWSASNATIPSGTGGSTTFTADFTTALQSLLTSTGTNGLTSWTAVLQGAGGPLSTLSQVSSLEGSNPASLALVYTLNGTGGATAGSSGQVTIVTNRISSGGSTAGGTALSPWHYDHVSTGGITAGSSAIVSKLGPALTGDGGIQANGSARISGRTSYTASGGLTAASMAIVLTQISIPSAGSILGGSADYGVVSSIIASGGILAAQPLFGVAPARYRVWQHVPRYKLNGTDLQGVLLPLFPVCPSIPLYVVKDGRQLAFRVLDFDSESGQAKIVVNTDLSAEVNNCFAVYC